MDKEDTNTKSYLHSTRAKLTKLEIKVASLPNIPEKDILQHELDVAKSSLEEGDAEYAKVLWNDIRGTISRVKLRYSIIPHSTSSNIQLVVRGLVIYGSIVSSSGFVL